VTVKLPAVAFFTLIVSLSAAQGIKTAELKPIHHQGLKYFYGFKKVDGGAYGLQIPLQSLNDAEIDRHYKKFKTIRALEAGLSFVPFVYIITNATSFNRRRVDAATFYTVTGLSILAILGVELVAQHQIKKSIDRYNEIILAPASGSLGATITYKF
jgi:hypothetical protein